MNQDILAAVVAAHETLVNFYLLAAPPLVSATGQLMAADREAVINLSPKLRTLGLPPYVIVHCRDPESVAVMTALRLRGAASPTGNLSEPLPLPNRMMSHWELNEHLERISDGGDSTVHDRVREIVLSSQNALSEDGASILAISRLPLKFLLAFEADITGEIKPLTVIRVQLDQEGRARSTANLGTL